MKLIVLFSCTLALASAAYYGPLHYPVIGPNGVPVEPIEVQAARASHLAAFSGHTTGYIPHVALPVPGQVLNALPLDTPEVASAKLQHYREFAVAAQRNGVYGVAPVDTPEVLQARAAHFQSHALARGHYRKRRSIYGYHVPVIGPNGVPVDTPEVQAARANHLAALSDAQSRGGAYYGAVGVYDQPHEPYQRYWGPQATIGPDGRPVETPEVQAAAAHHFAAHAAVRAGLGGSGHYF